MIVQNIKLQNLLTIYVYIFWINSSKKTSKINNKIHEKYKGTHIFSKYNNHIINNVINDHCLKLEFIWLSKTCHL